MTLFHVLNRGVDKRKIFLDDKDYFRAIHDLFEFNDENPAETTFHIFNKKYTTDVRRRDSQDIKIGQEKRPRKLLVKIHAFCLMPNHYHLLLSPVVENGISLFMKKFNGGYAKYFNEKYKRTGALFQGKYKKIIIKNETHFIHLPYYIHLNPLDLIAAEWRERNLNNLREAMSFMGSYRWSSHLDYTGKKNFPSIIDKNFLLDFFGGPKQYELSIAKWLKELSLEKVRDIALE